MKNNNIYNTIIYSLLALSCIGVFTACQDVNNWGTDDNFNRMFSPVTFETGTIAATNAQLRYSSIANAQSYVIEISEDSLLFGTIVQTVTILPTNMVIDSTSTSKAYLATVKDLEPEKRYSARMKTTSSDGIPDSRWVTVTFKTPGEQILDAVKNITESSATLTWAKGTTVTAIKLIEKGQSGQQITLSQQNITDGTIILSGLKDNTPYTVEIYNGDRKRGTKTFTTIQNISGDGKRYWLKADDNILEFLNTLSDEEVVLVLPANAEYPVLSTWEIPAQIKSLTLWGLVGDTKAKISFKELALLGANTSFKLWIHNMEVTGTSTGSDYILNNNAARTIPEFKIDNCTISLFRGLFRMRSSLTVNNIEIDNCLITTIGSYGLMTVDDAAVNVNNIAIKNSTIYNLENTSVMTFKAKPNTLNISYCTFYNAQGSGKYLLSFSEEKNVPTTLSVKNCIFSAPNAAVSVKGTSPKITSNFVTNSYKTNDYTIDSSGPLTGISNYNNSSTSLFEDPAKANFKIKDTGIGDGSRPGDPRWW